MKYNKGGYTKGAGNKMRKILQHYKISYFLPNSNTSRFFWSNYQNGKEIPIPMKKLIVKRLKKHLKELEEAIKIEDSQYNLYTEELGENTETEVSN